MKKISIQSTDKELPSQEQNYLPGGHNARTHASAPTMQQFLL